MSKTSLLPSLAGWQLHRALGELWDRLEVAERLRLLAYLVVPTLNRFVLLAGFAATMKGFLAVTRHSSHPATVWGYGGVMLIAFGLAALLQFAQLRIFCEIELDLRNVVRRVVGLELLRLGDSAAGSPPAAANLAVEKYLAKETAPGLLAGVELVAGLVFMALMVAAIAVALPIAAVVMAAIGLVLLAVYRLKVRHAKEGPDRESRGAAAERTRLVQSLLDGSAGEDALTEYEFNAADRFHERRKYRTKRRDSLMAGITSLVSALVVIVCFFLVSFTGLRTHDPIVLLIFVVAVRLFSVYGKRVLKDWTEILRRKNALFAFAMILTGRDGFAKLRNSGLAVSPERGTAGKTNGAVGANP